MGKSPWETGHRFLILVSFYMIEAKVERKTGACHELMWNRSAKTTEVYFATTGCLLSLAFNYKSFRNRKIYVFSTN